jgi:hypothetical protein
VAGSYEHSNEAHSFLVSFSGRFEVLTVVTMKNGVFWDVTPCGTCKKVLTRATQHSIPEDTILSFSGFKLSPLGMLATIWHVVPVLDDDERGATRE